jgi:hypothetical protein|tara:strand:- start:22 stop:336 length:315 start_codon:yes stop_codon:yes gene_type:complete
MKILEYKLDATANGMQCPPWIDEGGYWSKSDNTMIGVTRNNPKFHIPSSVHRLTASELETRQLGIHSATPMMKQGATPLDLMVEMTEAEVKTAVQNWVTDKGVD